MLSLGFLTGKTLINLFFEDSEIVWVTIGLFNSIFGVLHEKLDVPINILKLVNEREHARKNNDWTKSDNIRQELDKIGWNIKDTPSGPKLTAK